MTFKYNFRGNIVAVYGAKWDVIRYRNSLIAVGCIVKSREDLLRLLLIYKKKGLVSDLEELQLFEAVNAIQFD